MQPTAIRAGRCAVCGAEAIDISLHLGLCRTCVVQRYSEARPRIEAVHRVARLPFGLPDAPPRRPHGVTCPMCNRECRLGPGDRGFCGLRVGIRGDGGPRLHHLAGTGKRGLLQVYRDELPTNCVSSWVCGNRQRIGVHNLAVFYCSCTVSCLYCQNWHFREVAPQDGAVMSADELAACTNERTACICYFGGDPASQMPHALRTSRRLAERGIAVCWETAGTQRQALLDEMTEVDATAASSAAADMLSRRSDSCVPEVAQQ